MSLRAGAVLSWIRHSWTCPVITGGYRVHILPKLIATDGNRWQQIATDGKRWQQM